MNKRKDYLDLTQVRVARERRAMRRAMYRKALAVGGFVFACLVSMAIVGMFYYSWLN
jgi:hypothetical protein